MRNARAHNRLDSHRHHYVIVHAARSGDERSTNTGWETKLCRGRLLTTRRSTELASGLATLMPAHIVCEEQAGWLFRPKHAEGESSTHSAYLERLGLRLHKFQVFPQLVRGEARELILERPRRACYLRCCLCHCGRCLTVHRSHEHGPGADVWSSHEAPGASNSARKDGGPSCHRCHRLERPTVVERRVEREKPGCFEHNTFASTSPDAGLAVIRRAPRR